jgi:hypothetical protein
LLVPSRTDADAVNDGSSLDPANGKRSGGTKDARSKLLWIPVIGAIHDHSNNPKVLYTVKKLKSDQPER